MRVAPVGARHVLAGGEAAGSDQDPDNDLHAPHAGLPRDGRRGMKACSCPAGAATGRPFVGVPPAQPAGAGTGVGTSLFATAGEAAPPIPSAAAEADCRMTVAPSLAKSMPSAGNVL